MGSGDHRSSLGPDVVHAEGEGAGLEFFDDLTRPVVRVQNRLSDLHGEPDRSSFGELGGGGVEVSAPVSRFSVIGVMSLDFGDSSVSGHR